QLLQWVDTHVRVRADTELDAAVEEPLNRQKAVPHIRLARRAGADAHPRRPDQVGLVPVGLRGMHDGRTRTETAAGVEQLDGPDVVLGEALLDLAWLLVGVDVQRQLMLGGVASELLEPPARAGTDGVGSDADADPVRP